MICEWETFACVVFTRKHNAGVKRAQFWNSHRPTLVKCEVIARSAICRYKRLQLIHEQKCMRHFNPILAVRIWNNQITNSYCTRSWLCECIRPTFNSTHFNTHLWDISFVHNGIATLLPNRFLLTGSIFYSRFCSWKPPGRFNWTNSINCGSTRKWIGCTP